MLVKWICSTCSLITSHAVCPSTSSLSPRRPIHTQAGLQGTGRWEKGVYLALLHGCHPSMVSWAAQLLLVALWLQGGSSPWARWNLPLAHTWSLPRSPSISEPVPRLGVPPSWLLGLPSSQSFLPCRSWVTPESTVVSMKSSGRSSCSGCLFVTESTELGHLLTMGGRNSPRELTRGLGELFCVLKKQLTGGQSGR